MGNKTEALELIRRIKSYDQPPWNNKDPYWHRDPWQKFGGVSSGICMRWCWYRDDVIIRNVTEEDLSKAIRQLERKKMKVQFYGWRVQKYEAVSA